MTYARCMLQFQPKNLQKNIFHISLQISKPMTTHDEINFIFDFLSLKHVRVYQYSQDVSGYHRGLQSLLLLVQRHKTCYKYF